VTATCLLTGAPDAGSETAYNAYLYRFLGKHHNLLNYTTANEVIGQLLQLSYPSLINKSPFPPCPLLTNLLPFEFMIGGRTR